MEKKFTELFDQCVFLFQGGGALGAYQVGVFKGLQENGYSPNWLIGTSIGAINSAIIAGNPPDKQLERLNAFWDTIATKIPAAPHVLNDIILERWQHAWSALLTACFGQPGFFKPRWWDPWLSIASSTDKLSYYDTSELRQTLLDLIDFDYLNTKKIRLSVGAVRVVTGSLVYFDNTKTEIKPEHIMASCALPPSFPAICVDDKMFWDGGIHSNTQINLLLNESNALRYLCFMVHLFDSFDLRPTTMDDILKRQKDINYSSHHRQFIQVFRNIYNLRHAIHTLSEQLPKNKKDNPRLRKLIKLGRAGIIHLARFHYKGKLSDLSSKDYEFSLPSIKEHMECGYNDVVRTLIDPPWHKPHVKDTGLIVYEVSKNPVSEDNPF